MSVAHTLKPKFLSKSKDLIAKLAPHLQKNQSFFFSRKGSTASQGYNFIMKKAMM